MRLALRFRRKSDESHLAYNQRTAMKISEWMTFRWVKPIHLAIIERLFAHAWHERDVGQVAAVIRRDRDQAWWAGLCDWSVQARAKEELLHSKQGLQDHYDNVFVQVWVEHWRARLDKAKGREAWLAQKRSVQKVVFAVYIGEAVWRGWGFLERQKVVNMRASM